MRVVGSFLLVFTVVSAMAQVGQLASPLDRMLPLPDSTAVTPHKVTSVVRPVDVSTWPAFCRWEEKASKASNTQIRVRLGSSDYVDYLEGKGQRPR